MKPKRSTLQRSYWGHLHRPAREQGGLKEAVVKRGSTLRRKKSKVAVLRDRADRLYQIKLIKEKPRSVVSGEPTEVIHHFIQKKQSNNLRYDDKNGVPLTNREHARHHLSGDPAIVAKILEVMGQEWFDDLQARRRIVVSLNIGYLKEIIDKLKETKE